MSDLCEGARAAGWTQKKAEDWVRKLFDIIDRNGDIAQEEFDAHWAKVPVYKRSEMRVYLVEILNRLECYDEDHCTEES